MEETFEVLNKFISHDFEFEKNHKNDIIKKGSSSNFFYCFNKFRFCFNYVPQVEWVKDKKEINRHLEYFHIIDGGNCYINTFIISFFLINGYKLDQVYDLFKKLNDEEYCFIVSKLTSYVFFENIDLFILKEN